MKLFALGLVLAGLVGTIVFGQGRIVKAPVRHDTGPECNPNPLQPGILSAADVCAIIQGAAMSVTSPLVKEILQERVVSSRHRRNPRGVKRKMSNFPLRPRHIKPLPPIDIPQAIWIV